jgi:DNA repair ATPase RecN
MTEQEMKIALEWVKESENTNEYCERNLLIDALRQLEFDPPDINKAQQRLRELIPLGEPYHLVIPPDFVKE